MQIYLNSNWKVETKNNKLTYPNKILDLKPAEQS
jgi:hypothetical protein